MARKILVLFLIEALFCQVFTANLAMNPSLKQYLLSSLGSSSMTQPARQPSPAATISNQPADFQSLIALATLLAVAGHASSKSQPTTAHGLASQAGTPSISSLLAGLAAHPSGSHILSGFACQPSTSNILTSLKAQPSSNGNPVRLAQPSANSFIAGLPDSSSNGGIDPDLLNNLAMALQLLIASNLFSSPQSTTEHVPYYETETVQQIPVSSYSYPQNPAPQSTAPQKQESYQYYHQEQPQYNYQQPQPSMPSANFVGTSNYGDPFMGSVPPASGLSSSRSGFTLMSPYEALSPSSPFSDPILSSPYGSIMTSKNDFQSPYTAIMAADNKDVFSFSDFF